MQPDRPVPRFALMRVALLALSLLPMVAAEARVETGDQQLARILAGRTEGKAQSCLPLMNRNDSETIRGVGIAYNNGRTTWISRFDKGCAPKSDDVVVTTSPMGRPCRGDIVRFVERMTGFEHGACAFGDFVPYTKGK